MPGEHFSPRIHISRHIANGETPYGVAVQEDKVKSFLSSRGVNEQDFPNLRIRIRNKDLEEAANTIYDDKHEVDVSVSAGYAWKTYEEAVKAASDIVNGAEPKNRTFEKLLYTKRLPQYLQAAPKERGMATAQRLLLHGVSRETNASMLHELIHFADLQTGRHRFWYSTIGNFISNVFDFARYNLDQSERDAVRTEKKLKNDPSWRDILKINPRVSNS